MSELRSRSRQKDRPIRGDGAKRRVPGECAEGDDDADPGQGGKFADEVWAAVVTLDARWTIQRWRTTDGGCNVEIGQGETVAGPG